VWGVDPEPEMIEVARGKVPPGVGLKLGRAEALPFKDGWFERVTMTLVLQLVDRPRAYAEAIRVLQPGGRLAAHTRCVHCRSSRNLLRAEPPPTRASSSARRGRRRP